MRVRLFIASPYATASAEEAYPQMENRRNAKRHAVIGSRRGLLTSARWRPIAEHEVVTGDDAALERDALALAPHLGADGVAGKDRPREPRLDAFQPLRPAVGALPQDRARRDAEACRPMQNGAIEAGGLGALRIGVERILGAVEPVQPG